MNPHGSQDLARLLTELDQSKRELSRARDRIRELSAAQDHLSGAVRRLTELASTDVLTGLSNRRSFGEALTASIALAIRQNSPLSLVLIDVDRFKTYNDEYGHPAGDLVLTIVGKQLLAKCSSYDVVARHGGEEFAILLPAADAVQAMECAERQRLAISSYPWLLRRVTASLGVATLGPGNQDAMTLLEEADRSLYHSKRNGRDRVTHHLSLGDQVIRDHAVVLGHPSAPCQQVSTARPRPIEARPAIPPSPPASRIDPMCEAPIEASPAPRTLPAGLTRGDAPWEALDRFTRELQDGKQALDQYRTALSAICEGTGAQLAFLYAEQSAIVVETTAADAATKPPYREIARMLAEEMPEGGLWDPSLPPCGAEGEERPALSSAVVLRVEMPRPGWLIAVRFTHGRPFLPCDLQFLRLIWRLQVGYKRQLHAHDNMKETLFGVVRCLSTAIDAKDPYTSGHSERVARIAVRLGEEMKLSRGEISDLYLAGLLHDVGKIGISDEVLRKDGPLTPEEYAHIKEHPVIGERIIANVTRLAYLRPAIRGHHERVDGAGYPDGLIGDEIPLMARILAVADSCDAMMSNRRYRPALSQDKIGAIFQQGAGSQWDAGIVAHFLDCRGELYAVCQRGLGQSVYMAVERAAGHDPSRAGTLNVQHRSLSNHR